MKTRKFFEYINSRLWIFVFIATHLISFVIFDDFWEDCVNRLWVGPIVSKFINNEWWVISVYSFFILCYYGKEYFYAERINIKRIVVFLLFVSVYLICFFSGKWIYSKWVLGTINVVWAHIFIVLPLLCEVILCTKYWLSHKNNIQITADLEIEKVYNAEDSYKRKNLYTTTYKTLMTCFYKESSFAFSIMGVWGSGKTTFLNNLKLLYCKNSCISIIEFEPWKCDSANAITRDFLTLLCNELKLYIPNISSTINEYIDLLLDIDSAKPLKIFSKSILKAFNQHSNIYKSIKDCLEKSMHKTIVFIDDLDRLNADEIKEVLRLIRNTANFPFIQFIVAYDKEYICDVLKTNGINNPELYLEKFFNAELALPKYEERIICNELQTRVSKTIHAVWGISEDDTRIHDVIYYRSDDYTSDIIDCILVPKILHTIRDVIRFHNLFFLLSKTYKEQGVENEIEFQDLFYLELLQYRYSKVYSNLCQTPLLLLELNEDSMALKNDAKQILNDILNNKQEIEIVYDILCYLFLHSRRQCSMRHIRNYYKYFLYRLDDKILTISDFLSLENKKGNDFDEFVSNLYKNKYHSEFENLIIEILNQIPLNIERNKKHIHYTRVYGIIKNILTLSKHQPLRDEVSHVVTMHLNKLYCIDNEHLQATLKLFDLIDFNFKPTPYFDMDNFLLSILKKDNLAVKLHHQIGQDEYKIIHSFLSTTSNAVFVSPALSTFIQKIKSSDTDANNLLISLQELSDIQLSYFINSKDKLSKSGLILFYNCQKDIDPVTDKVILRSEALKLMKNEIEKSPERYLKIFIRTGDSSNPDFNIVSPEPFYKTIFGSDENFETFLENCNTGSIHEEKVKNYWSLYKNNGYSAIEFANQGNVQDKINNCFRNEILQLKELLYIKDLIRKNEGINDDIINMFTSNSLYIKLRKEISDKINKLQKS